MEQQPQSWTTPSPEMGTPTTPYGSPGPPHPSEAHPTHPGAALTPVAPQQPFPQQPHQPYPDTMTMGTTPVRTVTDQRQPSGAVMAIAWVLTVLTLGYLLPWAIAATRGRSNQGAIAVLNIFLGWSFVGWVVSLVMACQAHSVSVAPTANVLVVNQPPVQPSLPPAGWYPAPYGYGRQYWDGAAWTSHRA